MAPADAPLRDPAYRRCPLPLRQWLPVQRVSVGYRRRTTSAACWLLTAVLSAACGRLGFENSVPAFSDQGAPSGVDEADAEGAPLGPAGGASGVCDGAVLACADFEQEPGDWRARTSGAAVSRRVQDPVFEGASAFEARGGGGARAAAELDFPPPEGVVYFRAHALLPSETEIDDFNLVGFGRQFQYHTVDVNVHGGVLEYWLPNEQRAVLGGDDARVPRDRWFCLQVEFFPHETEGTVDAYLDGQLVLSESNVHTHPGFPPWSIAAGIDWSADSQQPLSVFLDAMAVDDAPIDCL